MSDVGDVNRAHMQQPEPVTELYMKAARRMTSPAASMTDRLAFLSLHNSDNVVKLANIIDALRAENAQLMEIVYGGGLDWRE